MQPAILQTNFPSHNFELKKLLTLPITHINHRTRFLFVSLGAKPFHDSFEQRKQKQSIKIMSSSRVVSSNQPKPPLYISSSPNKHSHKKIKQTHKFDT